MFRRAARIIPLYWALTSFAVIVGVLRNKPGFDPVSVLMSFLFLPWDAAGTGIPRPVFELGWTLNYEMFFYAVFALTLGFSREISALIVVTVLTALVFAGWMIQPSGAQAIVWTQPIILEFALGVLLALAARRNVILPLAVRIALLGIGAGALLFDLLHANTQPLGWVTPDDMWRVVAWGLPAALIVAGATLKAKATDRQPVAPVGALAHLGDASYALYLSHPIVMGAVSAVFFALGLGDKVNPWTGVCVSMILSVGVALAIHRFFEAPVTRALQNFAPRAKMATAPAE